MKKAFHLRLNIIALFTLISVSVFGQTGSGSMTFSHPDCFGLSNGTITLTITGGGNEYIYSVYETFNPANRIDIGPTTNLSETFSGLTGDNTLYTAIIYDNTLGLGFYSNGVTLVTPGELNATITPTNPTCSGENDGTITFSLPIGGSGAYEYSLDNATWQSNGDFTNLAPGIYTTYIRDANQTACSRALTSENLISPTALNANITAPAITCFGGTVDITLDNPSGGSGDYQYTINGGSTWQNGPTHTYLNQTAGTYDVRMRDLNNPTCEQDLDNALVLSQPNQILVQSIDIDKGLQCADDSDGELTANVTGGTTPYSFTWEKDVAGSWTDIGQNSQTATGLDQARYRVTVTDVNTCTPSSATIYFVAGFTDSIPLTVPQITGSSVVNACFGQNNGSISLTAANGTTPYTYSITTGGASGFQSSNTFNNLVGGTYETWLKDGKGCTKQGADVDVLEDPILAVSVSIAASPSSTICPGTNVLFTATPTNEGTTPTYQWKVNGSDVGSNSSTYNDATLTNGDQVTVELTSSERCNSGVATSNTITMSVNEVPVITGQPSGTTLCEGSNYTFTVTATGTGLTYQWRKDGTNITGATASSLALTGISSADAGDYDVIVSGTCPPSVTSATATLTVQTDPVITTQPSNVTQCEGANATFTVAATGSVLTYQWRKDGVNIGGANSTSYTVTGIAPADAGNYDVVVSGACGVPVTSSAAALTVETAPNITTQPSDVTECEGNNATFTVIATGDGLTYQWRKGGVDIPGEINASLTLNNISTADAADYTVAISGNCAPDVVSNIATLTVQTNPVITTQPADITQCEGTNATFTVAATGTGLTYQWRKGGVIIGGATSNSYTINNIAPTDAGNFDVVVTGTCGVPVTSSVAVLTVETAPNITTQPADVTECEGNNATFTVIATGDGLTYQWQKDAVDIPGETNASLTLNNISTADAADYTVAISGNCAPDVVSNIATLTVQTNPVITTQPADITQCEGTNATFTVAATGTGLTYQWRKGGVIIGGATSNSYTINNIAPADAGNFDVVVSGTCGVPVTSSVAVLTVETAPNITTQPADVTDCEGNNVTFTVIATGDGLTYQWRKDAVDIPGETNASLTLNNISTADAADYTVAISGNCAPDVVSNIATLTVQTNPVITTQPADITQCEGTNATFTVAATGSVLTYQWRKDGVNIGGATSNSYTINNIAPADAGNFDVVVSGACGVPVTSSVAALTVETAPNITTQPADVTECEGNDATFTVIATGDGLTYQWRKDGVDIPGETNASLTLTNIGAADAANYTVAISGNCNPAIVSDPALLTIEYAPVITLNPTGSTLCEGDNYTLNVTATGDGLTYQWRKDGVNIGGANASSLNLNSVVASDAGDYDVVVSGNCTPSATSTVATLVIDVAPVVTTDPADITICEATDANFAVIATGSDLSYQWQENQGSGWNNLIESATYVNVTTANLTVAGAASSMNGFRYRCVVSNPGCGSVNSAEAVLTIFTNPVVNTDPTDQTICENSNTSFSITASGTAITYQWEVNNGSGWSNVVDDAVYSNSNTATLTLTAAPSSLDGYQYRCLVDNGVCTSVTSAAATLTFNYDPVITTDPVDQIACLGTPVTFSVTATGTALNYQWRKNNVAIPGATSSNYTIASVALSDADVYDVVITNICNNATSAQATLTVNTPPNITAQPADVTECEGEDISFTVTATGTSLSYQWRKDDVDLLGETNNFLNINSISLGDAGFYDVVINGTCGTLTSNKAELDVTEIARITSEPSDMTVCDSGMATASITATGFAPAFQWQKYNYGTSSWDMIFDDANISGATTPDLTLNELTASDTGFYRCEVTDICNTIYSDSIQFSINTILATIGSPSPFLIDTATTEIEVSVVIENRFLRHDLGISLVDPNGNEIILKDSEGWILGCEVPTGNGYDVTFSNQLTNKVSLCGAPKIITGSFGADGFWAGIHGSDPSNGAWRIRLWDCESPGASSPPDGFMSYASISFIDVNGSGVTETVSYLASSINFPIEQPSVGCRNNDYTVPLGLQTSCSDTEDARAFVTVSGGVAPFSYLWTGPTAVPDTNQWDLGAGTYTVTVTDALGCQSTASVEVSSPAPIVFDTAYYTDSLLCFGDNNGQIVVKSSGGTGTLTYTLQPGDIPSAEADSGLFNNVTAGTWTVQVEDVNGCTIDTTFVIWEPTATQLDTTFIAVPLTCYGDSIGEITARASGGTGPYTFILHPTMDTLTSVSGDTTFTDLWQEKYLVSVRDANACDSVLSDTIFLSSPDSLQIDTLYADTIACYGETTDLSVVIAGGVAPYSVRMINGTDTTTVSTNDTAFFTADAGRNYILLDDANGCVGVTDSIDIFEPAELVLDTIYKTDSLLCNADTSGQITVKASGGTGLITYTLQPGNIPSAAADSGYFPNLGAGIYTVEIRDEKGCPIDSIGLDIWEPTATQLDTTFIAVPLICYGDSVGEIAARASGGTGPYTFILHPTMDTLTSVSGDTTFTDLWQEKYLVSVRDSYGCDSVLSDTIFLSSPDSLQIDTMYADAIACYGETTDLSVVIAGGVTPYSVRMINGTDTTTVSTNDTAFFTADAGRNYILLEDANGCMGITDSIDIVEPVEFILDTIYKTDALLCNGDTTGQIVAKATGGTGIVTYTLQPGNIPSASADSGYFPNLGAGIYSVEIRDDSGCDLDSLGLVILEPAVIQLDTVFISDSLACSGDADGSIKAKASGGTAPYTFILYPVLDTITSLSGDTTFIDLVENNYYIKVTDINGCDTITSDTLFLTSPNALFIDTLYADALKCYGDTSSLTVKASGGITPYTISAYNGTDSVFVSTSDSAIFDVSGGYQYIAVEDAGGCIKFDTILIPEPTTPLSFNSINVYDATGCWDSKNGSIKINATGGWGDYMYILDGVIVGDSIENLGAGKWPISVIDSGGVGCRIDSTVTITAPDYLDVYDETFPATADTLGRIELFSTGGTRPVEYYLDTVRYDNTSIFGTDSVFTDLTVGWYYYAAKDANGCINEDSTFVQALELEAEFSVNNPRCYSDYNGYSQLVIDVTDTTSSSPYSLFVRDLDTDDIYTDNFSGTSPFTHSFLIPEGRFYVRLTDFNGLIVDDTLSASVPDELIIDSVWIEPKTCSALGLDSLPTWNGSMAVDAYGGTGSLIYALNVYNPSGENIPNYRLADTGYFDGLGQYNWHNVYVQDENRCVDSAVTEIYPGGIGTVPTMYARYYQFSKLPILDTTVCKYNELTLVAGYSVNPNFPDQKYQSSAYWRPDSILIDESMDDVQEPWATFKITEDSTVIHVKYVDNAHNCMLLDSVRVDVFDAVDVPYGLETSPGYGYDTVTGRILATAGASIIINMDSAYHFTDVADGLLDEERNGELLNPDDYPADGGYQHIIYAENPEDSIYFTLGITSIGCVETDTIIIGVRPEIVNDSVFTVFTPNDDGYNDYWTIPYAHLYSDVEVEIYNRWGQLVYRQESYGSSEELQWGGKSMKSGKPLPVGTYMYVIIPNDGQTDPLSGTVTIVR